MLELATLWWFRNHFTCSSKSRDSLHSCVQNNEYQSPWWYLFFHFMLKRLAKGLTFGKSLMSIDQIRKGKLASNHLKWTLLLVVSPRPINLWVNGYPPSWLLNSFKQEVLGSTAMAIALHKRKNNLFFRLHINYRFH